MFHHNKKLELIYRGSRDTFTAASYHSNCDNKGPFVVLMISKDYNSIFGGYSDIPESSLH